MNDTYSLSCCCCCFYIISFGRKKNLIDMYDTLTVTHDRQNIKHQVWMILSQHRQQTDSHYMVTLVFIMLFPHHEILNTFELMMCFKLMTMYMTLTIYLIKIITHLLLLNLFKIKSMPLMIISCLNHCKK